MSVARQDPTVTRRYFYSIKDISIGGRCVCNGHANTCSLKDPRAQARLLACACRHNTCGIQVIYNRKNVLKQISNIKKMFFSVNNVVQDSNKRSGVRTPTLDPSNANVNNCDISLNINSIDYLLACNCHGHTDKCIYSEEVDLKGESLDIHGIYEGGGVCQNCRHNTQGINCNQCKDRFYRPYGKHWNETDVCSCKLLLNKCWAIENFKLTIPTSLQLRSFLFNWKLR